ncbi:MAG: glycyl-radical enzyme activating protein [Desulfobacteraceae bacterium]|nr:MAG: glycyl-radical enzyme activating protein [Desulfobacteraceae bacterium]
MSSGIIFDIKKYAIHDGPGIRTTVFFKGCPLRCQWCHNPESLQRAVTGLLRPDRCIGCGLCFQACSQQAIPSENDSFADSTRCRLCGACARICPAEARQMIGREVRVSEVIEEIKKDILFYDQSGGGITFSGGEPLMQPEFLLDLLEACGRLGLQRAVDTTGYAPSSVVLDTAKQTDLFLYDLKHMDAEKHKEYTGVSNELILANLELLARQGARIRIRAPVIPGLNDDAKNLQALKKFVLTLPGVRDVHLLPYHRAAREKYRRFNMPYDLEALLPPPKNRLEKIAAEWEAAGLRVHIGG